MPLTIKAIIRWEQLRKKSFSLINYADQEDIEDLLYTTTICKDGGMYTFELFRETLVNKKLVQEMAYVLDRESAVLSQFQKKVTASDISNSEGSPDYVGAIVSILIMAGLDAHYALNEMELCDLPLFLEAYERKKKEQMEESRMWTYLTILPHIDAKKMENGAKDLITFPWEEKKEATEISDIEAQRFEEFMKKGKDFLKS